MTTTLKIKSYSDEEISGIVTLLTRNGYAVNFRKGNNSAMMCEISDDTSKLKCDFDFNGTNGELFQQIFGMEFRLAALGNGAATSWWLNQPYSKTAEKIRESE